MRSHVLDLWPLVKSKYWIIVIISKIFGEHPGISFLIWKMQKNLVYKFHYITLRQVKLSIKATHSMHHMIYVRCMFVHMCYLLNFFQQNAICHKLDLCVFCHIPFIPDLIRHHPEHTHTHTYFSYFSLALKLLRLHAGCL